MPVFHLAAIAFEPNRTSFGKLHRLFQYLAVASAMGDVVFDVHFNLVPVLRLLALQIFIRSRNPIIPALELGITNEDPAIGIGCSSELKLQNKVSRKLPRRPHRLYAAPFRRGFYHDPAINCFISPIAAGRFPIEIVGPKSPTRQILAIEEADKS